MINLIFKPQYGYNTSPNELVELNTDYDLAKQNICYGEFSTTNIFIGENNSGKSRFLRFLFKNEFRALNESKVNEFFKIWEKETYKSSWNKPPKSKIVEFFDIYKKCSGKRVMDWYIGEYYAYYKNLEEIDTVFSNQNKFYFPSIRGIKNYKTIINNKLQSFKTNSASEIQNKDTINHFLDLLNLKENGLSDFDIYKEIIYNEYFSGTNVDKNSILTGGGLYNEIKSMLLSEEVNRTMIKKFQKFMSNNFFNGQDFQITPNETNKVIMVKVGDDEREIYNWGDGTQQLIVILYYLYKYKDQDDKVFFIEEPELYLHPGILRKFIEVINDKSNFPRHQYFITTHSNMILDTSADNNIEMSIFKFKKVKDVSKNMNKPFIIEQCNNGDVSLLNELGIRNSSVFLANCSIWVEGITDRLYLKHYLKLYCEKNNELKVYRENLDFSFIEYGGGNIVHFNFDHEDSNNDINSKYINNKIFLIADNDNSKEGSAKYKRKEHYREILKDNFYELECLEIENLITKETLEKVLIKNNPEHKEKIHLKFNRLKSFKNKAIGKYIDERFDGIGFKKYSAPSGTIKDKVKFCNDVISEIKDYDELSYEAKELIEKLYKFIESCNII